MICTYANWHGKHSLVQCDRGKTTHNILIGIFPSEIRAQCVTSILNHIRRTAAKQSVRKRTTFPINYISGSGKREIQVIESTLFLGYCAAGQYVRAFVICMHDFSFSHFPTVHVQMTLQIIIIFLFYHKRRFIYQNCIILHKQQTYARALLYIQFLYYVYLSN